MFEIGYDDNGLKDLGTNEPIDCTEIYSIELNEPSVQRFHDTRVFADAMSTIERVKTLKSEIAQKGNNLREYVESNDHEANLATVEKVVSDASNYVEKLSRLADNVFGYSPSSKVKISAMAMKCLTDNKKAQVVLETNLRTGVHEGNTPDLDALEELLTELEENDQPLTKLDNLHNVVFAPSEHEEDEDDDEDYDYDDYECDDCDCYGEYCDDCDCSDVHYEDEDC